MVSRLALRPPADSSASREHELKLAVPWHRLPAVSTWIRALTRPDGAFPENDLFTLYFDQRELSSLAEKLDGDCAKTKIRLRWYQTPRGKSRSGVFLEIKQRFGSTRGKHRFSLDLDPAAVLTAPFSREIGERVSQELAARGVGFSAGLFPTLLLRYRRCRFVEPISGARVALDSEIAPLAISPAVAHTFAPGPLPFGVFEIKGAGAQVPATLSRIVALGCRPRAMSKYALCLAGRSFFLEN